MRSYHPSEDGVLFDVGFYIGAAQGHIDFNSETAFLGYSVSLNQGKLPNILAF